MGLINTLYKNDVPAIVFTLDNDYVPFFSVALAGIIANSSKKNVYDIVILSSNVSSDNQQKILDFCKECSNVSIRFCNIHNIIKSKKQYMKSNINHINEVAFYRLFIPSIFKQYKKVIFLDCDICVDGDIAELYDVDLKDNYVAAAKWMFAVSKNADLKVSSIGFNETQYTHEVLSVPVEDYFNAGVMVFNIKQILKDNKHLEFIEKIKECDKFSYNDQDILNLCCHNKVKYLGVEWNFTRRFKDKDFVEAYDSMLNSKIKIYHYVGGDKPWLDHDRLFYNIYYMYATISPYRDVLFR